MPGAGLDGIVLRAARVGNRVPLASSAISYRNDRYFVLDRLRLASAPVDVIAAAGGGCAFVLVCVVGATVDFGVVTVPTALLLMRMDIHTTNARRKRPRAS